MTEAHDALTQPSRRTFLTHGSAAALAGTLLATSLSSRVHASDDETIKVALIGCGNRGAGAAVQALSTAGPVKLWALADAFPDRLSQCLTNLTQGQDKSTRDIQDRIDVPRERQFVGLDAYRKALDSGVDVVILTAPPGYRPLHFEAAVNAGKHVFMEKPVATDAPGIRRVLAAAEAAKAKDLKVGVGLQRRHQPSYQEAIRRIHDGELGPVIALRCYWNGGPPAKTPFARGDLGELEYQVRNWYFMNWLSGDHIVEQHVHNLDVCNWAMNGYPVSAEGMGGRQVRTGPEYGNIFDHHAVEFTYADGTRMLSQCRQIAGCSRKVAEEIDGAQARANLGTTYCEITSGDDRVWRSAGSRGPSANPYQIEHDVLFDAIRNHRPHNEAEYGAYGTMTAILGRLATYSGKVIGWDEALASNVTLTTDAESWSATAPLQPGPDGSYPIAVPGLTRVL